LLQEGKEGNEEEVEEEEKGVFNLYSNINQSIYICSIDNISYIFVKYLNSKWLRPDNLRSPMTKINKPLELLITGNLHRFLFKKILFKNLKQTNNYIIII